MTQLFELARTVVETTIVPAQLKQEEPPVLKYGAAQHYIHNVCAIL